MDTKTPLSNTTPSGLVSSLNEESSNPRVQSSAMSVPQLPRNARQTTQSGITNSACSERQQDVICKILQGYKVMVLLRGAPGCGKSTLARELLQATLPMEYVSCPADFVLSSDDFFYDAAGRYKYNISRLSDAHAFNQQRAHKLTAIGRSPVIIDNTNMQLWEMLPYVEVAVRYGYLVEILEPSTPWRLAPGKLARRTQHGVTADKIQRMLDKYERTTGSELVAMLKNTRYSAAMPQFRSYPPLALLQSFKPVTAEVPAPIEAPPFHWATPNNEESASGSAVWDCTAPKEQRASPRRQNREKRLSPVALAAAGGGGSGCEESGQLTDSGGGGGLLATDAWKPKLLELLKATDMEEDNNLLQPTTTETATNNTSHAFNSTMAFQRHAADCRNENASFASLRQIYPNKGLAELWDLFEKCNGDVDWAVDILLKEDELRTHADSTDFLLDENGAFEDFFTCNCDGSPGTEQQAAKRPTMTTFPPTLSQPKPQRQKARPARQNHWTKISLSDLVESPKYDLGQARTANTTAAAPVQMSEASTQTDLQEEEPDSQLIEISLGAELVQQLSSIFRHETEATFGEALPADAPLSKVFLSRSSAKELYLLWVESVYNRLEEQRHSTRRDDEDFARLLKIPKYEHYKQSPANMKELLDLEFAWRVSREDELAGAGAVDDLAAVDLAAHLTQLKLCEVFPDIPGDTLRQVLAAHENCYNTTVAVLNSNVLPPLSNGGAEEGTRIAPLLEMDARNGNTLGEPLEATSSSNRDDFYSMNPEEAKRLSLRQFEETRNLAAHHTQLKAECYQKAKEAVQKDNTAVAVYYSQVANFHKQKIELYNQRAANSIMEVHRYSQSNPDLLDLHYLYVVEAVACLDLFLDRHITALRGASRAYKHVFIITGRGLHSIGGVSSIKAKVKGRLKERNLRWSEVNPGLLKVKLFSASRHSRNI